MSARGRRLAEAAYYLQRFGLSAAFGVMAWTRLAVFWDPRTPGYVEASLAAPSHPRAVLYLQQLTQSAILVAFNVLVGVLLLLTRRPQRPPERLVHLVVPVVVTFSYLGLGVAEELPDALVELRLLPELGLGGALVSGALVLAAYAFALLALAYLRRSFAVFVEVRGCVTGGPYRCVRHPMYLSYVLVLLALFVNRPTAAHALIVGLLVAGTYVRARMEERMLAAHAPGYAAYARRTGMLLPRLRPRRRA